ncbi:MAG: DUF2478 domain-containing protein [Rubrivivax sp.]|nr:DUF2478 domain-containing protein [Rubrivivax sp.]
MSEETGCEIPLRVAAIDPAGRVDIDALLFDFVARQRRAGRRVQGLLMAPRDAADGCRAQMWLTDVDSGDTYLVSQPLGAGSTGCAADPQGFARASRVLRDALQRRPDLVVCDRFGALEAENGGFVAEIGALLAAGIPVLTVVAAKHHAAWERFIGQAPWLAAEPAAWDDWLDGVLQAA